MGESLSDGSIEQVYAKDIYPKVPLHSDDDRLNVPYPMLAGESAQFLGSTADGVIVLSSYRLYFSNKNMSFNIPLGLIENVESHDIFNFCVYCKDARSYRCSFENSYDCQKWFKRIQKAVLSPRKLDSHFGFIFFLWSKDGNDIFSQLCPNPEDTLESRVMICEGKRMCFNWDIWRLSEINSDYSLCPSYPRNIIVPASMSEESLEIVAKFRFSKRIPAIVWRHQRNGCVIARCSQPQTGIFGWREKCDEMLLQSIIYACAATASNTASTNGEQRSDAVEDNSSNNGIASACSVFQNGVNENSEKARSKLVVIDARSYTVAYANKAKGGGFEHSSYYPNCEIRFLGLTNIHGIRKSFLGIRSLCADQQNWLSALDKTNWMQYLADLLCGASLVVKIVDVEKKPVLVHCSDGWDRTPQIVALAELMMDPYYRTRKGFQILVEKEWLEFGHKFADRCGSFTGTDDLNERCPVFLQWLDCVHQLVHQFPTYFEFNQLYLVKLVHHTYSCLFGTFLCNTDQERRINRVADRTFSVWPFLNEKDDFKNYLYHKSSQVLKPSCYAKDLHFWNEVYLPVSQGTYDDCQDSDVKGDDVASCSTPAENLCDLQQQTPTSDRNGLNAPVFLENINHEDGFAETKNVLSASNQQGTNETFFNNSSCFGKQQKNFPDRIRSMSNFNLQQNCDVNTTKNALPESQIFSFEALESLRLSDSQVPVPISSKHETSECLANDSQKPFTDETFSNRTISPSDYVNLYHNFENKELQIDCSTDTLVSETSVTPPDIKELTEDEVFNHLEKQEDERRTRTVSTNTPSLATSFGICINCTNIGNIRPFKINSSNCSDRSYDTEHHSRTPSSGFPATPDDDTADMSAVEGRALSPLDKLDIDGSTIISDEIQKRLQRLFKCQERKVRRLRNALASSERCQNCIKIAGGISDGDEDVSSADSICSEEHPVENSLGSDKSWEQLEPPNLTLWVPDHAATHCSTCECKFWTGRRRHHCRKCGNVFCYECSSQMVPVPTEQLFHPVRVCNQCFGELHSQCRQSVISCDKILKSVITAASN